MLLILTLLIAALLAGYCWGKHDGRLEGCKQGAAHLSLLLREQSLEQGYCSLCNTYPSEGEKDFYSMTKSLDKRCYDFDGYD